MSNFKTTAALAIGLTTLLSGPVTGAFAQDSSSGTPPKHSPAVTPPEPPTGSSPPTPAPPPLPYKVPGMPTGAKEVYDKRMLEQMLYLVNDTRRMLNRANATLKELEDHKLLFEKMTTSGRKSLEAITGEKNIRMHNKAEDIAKRKAGPSMQKVMLGMFPGNKEAGSGRIKNLIQEIAHRYELEAMFTATGSSTADPRTMAVSAQAIFAAATAEDGYMRSNESMDRLEDYMKKINNTDNDLKTAVDLNTRVLAEIAQQINETLRVQAATASVNSSFVLFTQTSAEDVYDLFDVDALND